MDKRLHTTCLITVINGDNELIQRRELWHGIVQISLGISDNPWLVMGDFNVVIDASEVLGNAADTFVSMAEFRICITIAKIIHISFAGAEFSWHNCSDGGKSLRKRLDRMLVNETWLVAWPQTSYLCDSPRTSDHSHLILRGQKLRKEDDILLFCQANLHSGTVIHDVLQEFSLMFGLIADSQMSQKADSIWVTWIQQNRLEQQTIWSFHGAYGSWGWKQLLKIRNKFLTSVEIKVGDGDSFRLWSDPWHPDGPLVHKVSRGPKIIGLPVDSCLNSFIHQGLWNCPSSRNMDIRDIIARFPPIHYGMPDRIFWNGPPGTFSSQGVIHRSPLSQIRLNGRSSFRAHL
ncbi:hypothetical protein Sango_1275200 [Sesamum angolense]|uniref:Endonuclease/exonuclease/phosphatase domain-containing protein n=1 Tax=Sesamum angolense TaxID=2727404 RepID=A0AAE2BU86_9LAMI|nr:hypothetical protein Sango_1275200 [Sesamum angolense]